jgi:hypothetical protein
VGSEERIHVGEECAQADLQAQLSVRQTISRGIVQHWDDLEILWCAVISICFA